MKKYLWMLSAAVVIGTLRVKNSLPLRKEVMKMEELLPLKMYPCTLMQFYVKVLQYPIKS